MRESGGWLVIETARGGRWRLMGIWRPNKYLGKPVTVEGRKERADVLHVRKITLARIQ